MKNVLYFITVIFLYLPVLIIITISYLILGCCLLGYYILNKMIEAAEYLKGVINGLRLK